MNCTSGSTPPKTTESPLDEVYLVLLPGRYEIPMDDPLGHPLERREIKYLHVPGKSMGLWVSARDLKATIPCFSFEGEGLFVSQSPRMRAVRTADCDRDQPQ